MVHKTCVLYYSLPKAYKNENADVIKMCSLLCLVLNSWEHDGESAAPTLEMSHDQSCFYVPPLDIDVVPLNRALNPEWLRWEPSV